MQRSRCGDLWVSYFDEGVLGGRDPGRAGLERFVRGEALRRVHECIFGVLALESEPVDPRR